MFDKEISQQGKNTITKTQKKQMLFCFLLLQIYFKIWVL